MPRFWPWQRVIHYQCPDGIRVVYRDLDHALPLYLSDHKERTAAAFKVAHELEAKAEKQYEERIKSVLFNLNKYNSSNQQHLRAAYLIYMASPCDNLKYFIKAVEEVREYEARLNRAEFLMKNILGMLAKPTIIRAMKVGNNPSEDPVITLFNKVLNTLDRPAYVNIMIEELNEVTTRTEEWARV